ncbi:hypothetical protein OHB93_02285 [Microbacterium sp. No. 7]|uniref:hypothetical protein n=1 Tax=Microbacterium sp. No. 7 TaxID=1714373 RepID=UPI00300BE472
MGTMRRAALVIAILAGVGFVSGCAGVGGRYDYEEGPQPGYEDFVDDPYVEGDSAPSDAEIDFYIRRSEDRVREDLGVGSWSCDLAPTLNDDWHDDVLCSNGSESHRPYLREWDTFVEEWELLESAEEYEAELNAGG